MKILVLVKPTPDTETKIRLSGDQKRLELSDAKFIINPYDEFAIEEALKIKDKDPSTEVVILSLGADSSRELIIKGLAMGADRGVLVQHAGIEAADSLTIAQVIAKVVSQENPQLVLCGRQGIDDDNMHVGTMLAELLQWPHVNVVTKLTLNGNNASVEREIEGGQIELYELSLPAVLGAHKSLNKPRYAPLPGIMKAKSKPLALKSLQDLGFDAQKLMSEASVTTLSYHLPPEKPKGKIFKDETPEAMVTKVVQLLREEARVI